MSNDINILVTTELGDTFVKLDLAKHAVNDLGDESEKTAAKQDEASASTAFFTGVLGGLNSALTTSVPLLGTGFSVSLAALPAIAVGAAAAIVGLADAFGAVVAILADLAGPLTLVAGLIGGLGVAFAVAAKKAFGMNEDGFGKAVAGLKKQFDDLTTTLVGRFMPVFQFLIHNAHDALDFLGRIAKLPLDQAFKQLAQQGVPAVKNFLDQIGHLIGRPIRLAFQIAFGEGKAGNEVAAAASQLWNEVSNFLFGYTKTHFIRLDGRVIQINKQQVSGIFQPLIDWFDRHNFTKQGQKIGHELLNGLKPLAKPIGQFIVATFEDAVKTAVRGMLNAINPFSHGTQVKVRALNDWITHELVAGGRAAWNAIRNIASQAWNAVQRAAQRAWSRIGSAGRAAVLALVAVVAGPLVGAWRGVMGAVRTVTALIHGAVGAVQALIGALQSALSIAESVANAVRLGSGSVSAPGHGTVPGRAGGFLGPHTAVGGNATGANVVVVHVHGADLSDRAQRDRIGHQLGDTIFRQLNRNAGV